MDSPYFRDQADRLNCRHGVILYGDSCVQCERDAATAPPRGVPPVAGPSYHGQPVPPFSRPGETEAIERAAAHYGLGNHRHPVDVLAAQAEAAGRQIDPLEAAQLR